MKKIILLLIVLLTAVQFSFTQTEPTRNDALAVLKKYNYVLYVSKKTGFQVSQLKFENLSTLYSGKEAMYRYQTNVAKRYSWPNDRLVYTFKIVTPKDKDGVQTKYHFHVVYALSKCLTDGKGCLLLNSWELESANKYGPFFMGAKSVSSEQIVELIKDRFINEKETVLKELSSINVENWIKIDSIIPTEQVYKIYKEEVITKTKRKNSFLFTVDRVVMDYYDPKIEALINVSYKATVIYELIDGSWQITEMSARASGKNNNENYDVNNMYLTFKDGSFDDVYEKRTQVDFPVESCTSITAAAINYLSELKKGDFNNESFKALYLNEESYQKDLKLFNYFEEQGFSYEVDSSSFYCKSYNKAPRFQIYFTTKHTKFKGKVMKDWRSKCVSSQSIQYKAKSFYAKGLIKQNISLEFELVEGKWKVKSIASQILPDL